MLFRSRGGAPIGSTGGEEMHTLTIEEMPSHVHQLAFFEGESGGLGAAALGRNTLPFDFANDRIGTSGGSQPHNNMPPYIAVNIWKRVA